VLGLVDGERGRKDQRRRDGVESQWRKGFGGNHAEKEGGWTRSRRERVCVVGILKEEREWEG
jgi:hypothetical protein